MLSCFLKYTDVFWSAIGAKRGFLPRQFGEILVSSVQAKNYSCFSQSFDRISANKADGRLSEKVGGKCRTLKSKLFSLIGNFSLTFENVYSWIKWKLYFKKNSRMRQSPVSPVLCFLIKTVANVAASKITVTLWPWSPTTQSALIFLHTNSL